MLLRCFLLMVVLTVLPATEPLGDPADGPVELTLAEISAALAGQPHDAALHEQYGWALRRADRLAEAEAAFKRSLVIEANADRQHALGSVLAKQDRHSEAFSAYAAGLRLDASHQPCVLAAGALLEKAGHFTEAISLYRAALAADRELQAAWFGLGRSHQAGGEWDFARQAYGEVLRIDYQHLQARARLIQVLQGAGLATERDHAVARFYRLRAQAGADEPLRRIARFTREMSSFSNGQLVVDEHFNPLQGPLWRFRWQGTDGTADEIVLRLTIDGWMLNQGERLLRSGSGLPRYDEIRPQVIATVGAAG